MPSHEKRLFRRNKSLRHSLFDNPHVPLVRSGMSHNLCLDLGTLWKHLSPLYRKESVFCSVGFIFDSN